MEIDIDIRDSSIVINGDTVENTLDVERLTQLLGEPRVRKNEPDKNYRAYMEERRGKNYFDNFKSLVWDDAGIYSHSENGRTLISFGIVFDNSKKTAPHTPKSVFSGTLKVNGEDWLSAIKKGRDMFGNYCKLDLAKFVAFAEYQPGKMPLSERTEKDFTLIEITHTY